MTIYSLIQDAGTLLALEPEELAGVVMEYLNSLPPHEQGGLNRYNFGLQHTVREYPQEHQEALRQALMEAWVWLEREGLLVPKPGSSGEWVFISRRGQQLRTRADVDAYRENSRLPRQQLHPRIAQRAAAAFLRGEYDVAVLQAFKAVEVCVREAGRYEDTDIGVPLMRKAFGRTGPLTDAEAPEPEQEALAHLFSGAIGSYKNPHSHRNVSIDATSAAEIIVLASHLLGIVDERGSCVADSD